MTQTSLIPDLDGLIRVDRVAPDEESLVKGLLREAVNVPAEALDYVVAVTATDHDAFGNVRVTAVLFDGETATFQISLPHEPGSRPSIRWLSDHREAPIGYDRARKLWRRYPEFMLVSDEAREALDRLNVDDAEKVLKAEKRREAALRAAETRRRNREAEERARGSP